MITKQAVIYHFEQDIYATAACCVDKSGTCKQGECELWNEKTRECKASVNGVLPFAVGWSKHFEALMNKTELED